MTTTIKIALVIAVAVVMVALISQNFGPKNKEKRSFSEAHEVKKYESIPNFLQKSFPNTDFSKINPAIEKVLSGGPPKDGIPAIDKPKFIPLADFTRSEAIQVLVLEDGDGIKVYPYNILTLHEIVNDSVNGVPVAVTFCPLCGSAIVYDRRSVGDTTFGVSGALIESNMVMYDRATESLWQQSTGEALAGELLGSQLELYPFQLSTIGEVRSKNPDALVLSEDTGHLRNYGRNPYGDYNENNQFLFSPSSLDERFEAKEIMVVFRVGDVAAATPWNLLLEDKNKSAIVNEVALTLETEDGELTIRDDSGNEYSFFYEMWFSFAVQNPEGVVVD